MTYPNISGQTLEALGLDAYLAAIVPTSNAQIQQVGFEDFKNTLLSNGTGLTINTRYGLSAQGTTVNTTSLLEYGINVFTTVTLTNYATKLPQPTTGKGVIIVNKGTTPLYVFPSNPGGEINNLGVDQPAVVPADGNAYTFYCIENPLPGQWSVTGLLGSLLQTNPAQEISVSHTTGTATLVHGWVQAASGSFGIYNAGGGTYGLNIPSSGTGPVSDYFVTGYTAQVPTRTAVAVKWQTNGTLLTLQTDPKGPTDLVGVKLRYHEAFMNGPGSVVNLTNRSQIVFSPLYLNPTGYSSVTGNSSSANLTFNPGGPAYTGLIGDLGTIDAYIPFTTPRDFGFNGFSNVYFIFTIDISSPTQTGVYKFLPYVEYY
jgi:hypothetical protein